MANNNNVEFIGNIFHGTKEDPTPKVHDFGNGRYVGTANLSVSKGKDKDDNWKPSMFLRFKVFGDEEAMDKFKAIPNKGRIRTVGTLNIEQWENDTASGTTVEIVSDMFVVLPKREDNQQQGQQQEAVAGSYNSL